MADSTSASAPASAAAAPAGRSRRRSRRDVNTLPLELQGLTSTVTTPAIYALGTVTTVVSFAVMGLTVGLAMWLRKK